MVINIAAVMIRSVYAETICTDSSHTVLSQSWYKNSTKKEKTITIVVQKQYKKRKDYHNRGTKPLQKKKCFEENKDEDDGGGDGDEDECEDNYDDGDDDYGEDDH